LFLQEQIKDIIITLFQAHGQRSPIFIHLESRCHATCCVAMDAVPKRALQGRLEVFGDKGAPRPLSTTLFGASSLATIDNRRFFVRDMVSAGVLKLVPLRTHLMFADVLTKRLPSPSHIKHREIMLRHVPFSFADRTLRRSVGVGG